MISIHVRLSRALYCLLCTHSDAGKRTTHSPPLLLSSSRLFRVNSAKDVVQKQSRPANPQNKTSSSARPQEGSTFSLSKSVQGKCQNERIVQLVWYYRLGWEFGRDHNPAAALCSVLHSPKRFLLEFTASNPHCLLLIYRITPSVHTSRVGWASLQLIDEWH
jgi:hypothetical protein